MSRTPSWFRTILPAQATPPWVRPSPARCSPVSRRPRADGPALPPPLPGGGRDQDDRRGEEPARRPAHAPRLGRRGRRGGSAVMERRTRRSARMQGFRFRVVPGDNAATRLGAPRRGLPRRARRRGDPRGRQRLRDAASYGGDDRDGERQPRGAARGGAGGLDDHLPPDRLDGGAATGRSGWSSPSRRPTSTPTTSTTSSATSRQRLAVRRQDRRAARAGRRCQALDRRAARLQPLGGDKRSAVSTKRANAMVDAPATRMAQLSGHA